MKPIRISLFLLLFGIIYGLFLPGCVPYRKMSPPADADKPGGIGTDNSCYLATASNMLAGAGYGDGATLQARADDIYGDLTSQFGIASGGWTDVALSWWLGSTNNTWPANPYTQVTVYGNKSPKNPWANTNGTQFYANELRKCCMVGLSISWPIAGAQVGSGGHAITAWGDEERTSSALTINPDEVAVSDSDRDTGGDEQLYNYDVYTSPNPGGANEGNGWYMDYSANHPYLKHIITLCPTDDPTDFVLTQKVTGSYKITQTSQDPATDLHYTVRTDVEILSYRTWISWETENDPVITENGTPTNSITVDWDLSDNPVPQGKDVYIFTEFVLPSYNAMRYSDVHWTYTDGGDNKSGPNFADIAWRIETPVIREQKFPANATGGFVIGTFEIIDPSRENARRVETYRFVHEYSYNQSPEQHVLLLAGENETLVRNLRLGHSWNYPGRDDLWEFRNWMYRNPDEVMLTQDPVAFEIDWRGKLPYPEGENIYKAIPDLNGEQRKPDDDK